MLHTIIQLYHAFELPILVAVFLAGFFLSRHSDTILHKHNEAVTDLKERMDTAIQGVTGAQELEKALEPFSQESQALDSPSAAARMKYERLTFTLAGFLLMAGSIVGLWIGGYYDTFLHRLFG